MNLKQVTVIKCIKDILTYDLPVEEEINKLCLPEDAKENLIIGINDIINELSYV